MQGTGVTRKRVSDNCHKQRGWSGTDPRFRTADDCGIKLEGQHMSRTTSYTSMGAR